MAPEIAKGVRVGVMLVIAPSESLNRMLAPPYQSYVPPFPISRMHPPSPRSACLVPRMDVRQVLKKQPHIVC